MSRATVAAVIPTKNVADFIAGALESLRFCDEVIIVDMFSTDDTRKICESYPNVRFFQRQDYIYGNFNFGVEQARSEWIIRLDSDERLSPKLQREIEHLLNGEIRADVYLAPFTSYVLGHPIRHGSAWEQPVRTTLFRKGSVAYEVRSEHEDLTPANPKITPRIARLRHCYVHFSMPSISKFITKLDYYTERDYERTDPRAVRVRRPLRLMYSVPKYFIHQYLVRRGYRDGYAGFAICALNAVYRLVHELKGWECANHLRQHHVIERKAYDDQLRAFATGQVASDSEPVSAFRDCDRHA